jgi:tungstate transport system substrate-binding protein
VVKAFAVIMPRLAAGLALSLWAMAAAPSLAQGSFITVASTTSTEQSGLFDHILPASSRRRRASRSG